MEALQSMTKAEVKNLTDLKEDGYDTASPNTKLLDCFLYGTKYYCTKNIANKSKFVFDFCKKANTTSLNNNKVSNELDSVTTRQEEYKTNEKNSKKQKEHNDSDKLFILQNTPHKFGFTRIEFVKRVRPHSDGNCFYIDGQSKRKQKQLRHCFLRIYQPTTQIHKKYYKIKLVDDWKQMYWGHWSKVAAVKFNSKLYKSIPFFIVLVQFLFGNGNGDAKQYNYMSLMESIDCLLSFKNYHQGENRNDHEFEKCNQVLNRKLKNVAMENHEFAILL